MAGQLSKGIKLSYGTTSASYTDIDGLQSTPDIGPGQPDTVEVTVLADNQHKYIDGLLSLGDSVEFTFLYDENTAAGIATAASTGEYWKLTIPLGTGNKTISWQGKGSYVISGVGTNAALTAKLKVTINSAITIA